MNLAKMLERVEYECISGTTDVEITQVVNDSRKAGPGALFLCIRGAVVDGHTFADAVVKQGVRALVVEEEVDVPEGVTVIKVADSRYAMALIAAAWYGHPASQLKVIGITGTKGKTTTTYMVNPFWKTQDIKWG